MQRTNRPIVSDGQAVPRRGRRKTIEDAGDGSLSDVAYARILESLFDRRLPAGAFVSQAELVALTGVPVAPLRDALRVLQVEGVVSIHPRSGIKFVEPGFELTRSTYQFRGIIEAAAIAVYAETAADADIEALLRDHQSVVDALEREGLSPGHLEEIEALEQRLHGSIVASLNNPLIESSYRRIHNYLRLLRLERRITTPIALRSLREHIAIIEACRRRSAPEAVAALQAHFSAALQRYLGLF